MHLLQLQINLPYEHILEGQLRALLNRKFSFILRTELYWLDSSPTVGAAYNQNTKEYTVPHWHVQICMLETGFALKYKEHYLIKS